MAVKITSLDQNGLPLSEPATVSLYDAQDRLYAGPVNSMNGIAELHIKPKPTIPHLTEFITTQIGYTEETAETGYAFYGYGFSKDADVVMNGVSMNERPDWIWEIISSEAILFLPPNEQHLFKIPTKVQIVNPNTIASNEYNFNP